MNSTALIQKFRKMPWEHWLKRRYPVLVPYLMARGAAKQAFARCGVKGEWPIILFERGVWYGTDEMFESAGNYAEKYLKKLGANFLTKICSLGYKKATREINRMLKDVKTSPLTQYKRVVDLLEPINVSVWTAHASEVYLDSILRKRLIKYIALEKLDEYIGDVGFPTRKNAHALLATDVLKGVGVKKLHEKYGWMKSRTDAGFGYGYTLEEVEQLRRDILNNPPARHTCPRVPQELKSLVKALREIVYLRTLRSDCLFEIYFRSAPIFARLEKELNIDSVGHYLPEDLIAGKPNRYGDQDCAVLKYYDDIAVTKEKIVGERIIGKPEIRGVITWKGKASGRVRVVFSPTEAHLVKQGEILVTNMTVPAYLLAMKKAAAFVTDEGGITCHAAIIAREMKKPCIIGAKIATQVLKDGDLVEVDAEKGVVRKI
ncbi:MAG: hypothetical protein HY980_00980 [Candidatus Magasanikbacteria bacterium]|nr:hypothetical protein [Candidatus Magasanikbacteria bacterium]